MTGPVEALTAGLKPIWDAAKTFVPAPVFISLCALAFTIYSFYWMHWRRARLVARGPRSFALGFHPTERTLIIRVPIVLFNEGAVPIVVENLRLDFPSLSTARRLTFIATVPTLGSKDEREFAVQYAVDGKSTLTLIAEFQKKSSEPLPPGRHTALLYAQCDGNPKWFLLHEFGLILKRDAAEDGVNRFLVFDNKIETLDE
jgi:hypothetical protein